MDYSVTWSDHLGRVVAHRQVEADSLDAAAKKAVDGPAPGSHWPSNATQFAVVALVP